MFNLTKQEQQAILFIFSFALAGLGVDYSAKAMRRPRLLACFEERLGKLDLNQVDASGLMKLPGIGEKLALRIIEYRREHYGFRDIEELRNIKGITSGRFAKLKNLLFVAGQ